MTAWPPRRIATRLTVAQLSAALWVVRTWCSGEGGQTYGRTDTRVHEAGGQEAGAREEGMGKVGMGVQERFAARFRC